MSKKKDPEIVAGIIVTENEIVTFVEVCNMIYASPELIKEMVSEGFVNPKGNDPQEWEFTLTEVVRLQTAQRLQRDFDLSLSGVGLALDLLDEVRELRVKVAELEKLTLGGAE